MKRPETITYIVGLHEDGTIKCCYVKEQKVVVKPSIMLITKVLKKL